MDDLYKTDCILTFTGLSMNVFEPIPEMVCIEDIAHSLSQMPRFGGHLPDFYSVAQHSYLCSTMADIKFKKTALLHDATEAYLMDIPSPIKRRLPDYKAIEDNLMKVIALKFNIEYPFHKQIKELDKYMLEIEWNLIMQKGIGKFPKLLTPVEAEKQFLEYFHLINN